MALTKYNYNSFDLTTAASKGLAFNSSANGFETSSSTSMVLIKTLTASSSANLQFVHGSSDVVLDSTYPVYLFKLINKVFHLFNRNSIKRARKNISAHYDLGNDFYKLWLDESMTYSSAYFGEKKISLKEKDHRLLRVSNLK